MEKTIANETTFLNGKHEERFIDLMKVQMMIRPKIFRREYAVLYLISAMEYENINELFNEKGCYLNIDTACTNYLLEELTERDAIIFLLAVNMFNGSDEFESFGIDAKATPYHFATLLGSESMLMNEASNIFMNGYNLLLIQ